MRGILAQVSGVTQTRIKINTMLLGCGFGRRFAPDFMIDATLLSKLSGTPVKLIYTREDDMAAGYYRPASLVRFEGGLDAKGQVSLLRADVASPSIISAPGFMKLPESGVMRWRLKAWPTTPTTSPISALPTAVPSRARRSGSGARSDIRKTRFLLSSSTKWPPLPRPTTAVPLALPSKKPRHRAVLEAAAARAGWGQPLPDNVKRGIAVAEFWQLP
ncbi:molybdopterin cofactor-binding domain-containing protein [Roseateles sp. GG27B]